MISLFISDYGLLGSVSLGVCWGSTFSGQLCGKELFNFCHSRSRDRKQTGLMPKFSQRIHQQWIRTCPQWANNQNTFIYCLLRHGFCGEHLLSKP